jgi:hypothetical protein
MGIEIVVGDPGENRPGERIAIPTSVLDMRVVDVDLARLRTSYLRRASAEADGDLAGELGFLAEETRWTEHDVLTALRADG